MGSGGSRPAQEEEVTAADLHAFVRDHAQHLLADNDDDPSADDDFLSKLAATGIGPGHRDLPYLLFDGKKMWPSPFLTAVLGLLRRQFRQRLQPKEDESMDDFLIRLYAARGDALSIHIAMCHGYVDDDARAPPERIDARRKYLEDYLRSSTFDPLLREMDDEMMRMTELLLDAATSTAPSPVILTKVQEWKRVVMEALGEKAPATTNPTDLDKLGQTVVALQDRAHAQDAWVRKELQDMPDRDMADALEEVLYTEAAADTYS